MTIRMKDALQLDYIKALSPLTDDSGYNNLITAVGILDHEVLEDNYAVFQKGELVISTLSVARDDLQMVMAAVQGLVGAQASALAIKSIYYKSLPQDIIDYANHHHFPIFVFESIFVEHLINSVNQALHSNLMHDVFEAKVEALLKANVSQYIHDQLIQEINADFKDSHRVYFLKEKQYVSSDKLIQTVNAFMKVRKQYASHSLLKFRSGLLLILTHDMAHKQANLDFSQLLRQLQVDKNLYYIGSSDDHTCLHQVNKAIEEAYTAYQAAEIQNKASLAFGDLGLYQLILPLMDQATAMAYAKKLIQPILAYDLAHKSQLYPTLKVYFDSACHTKVTADSLFSHKNTILYRIQKVRSLVGPFTSDLDFTTQMSLAIKLYESLYQSPHHHL